MRRYVVVGIYAVLAVVAVLVFLAFDASSHSASDTIRPFLITMAPLVILALVAVRLVPGRPS